MKTILYVYHSSVIGGGSYCLLNLLNEVDRSLYKPIVLLRNHGPLVKEIEKLNIDVYFLPDMRVVPYNTSTFSIWALRNAISIIKSFKRFKQFVKEASPDLLYVNSMMLYPYLRVAKKIGMKTVIHIREHWPEGEHKWQRKIAINHIHKYADEIVAINSYSASMVSNASHHPVIVYDWIDLSKRDEPISLNNIFGEDVSKKKVFLYMGGLQDIKGPKEVISCFTSHIKDKDSRLLVMGVDPNEQMSQKTMSKLQIFMRPKQATPLSKQVTNLINKDSRIKCMPSTYMVCDLYKQAYCILSFFKIPHANLALAESIISGTINVAASTPESIEYSHNGNLAMLYELGSKESFVAMLSTLSENHDRMKRRIAKDAHFVQEMFDKQRNVNILNLLYCKLLSNEK